MGSWGVPIAVAAAAALFASCRSAGDATCASDADCGLGQICVYPFPGCDVQKRCMIEESHCSFESRGPCEAPDPVCACSGGTVTVSDRASASYMPFPIRKVGACSDGGVARCPADTGSPSLPTGTCDIDLTCKLHVRGFCPCAGDEAPLDEYTCTCTTDGPWVCAVTARGEPACAHGQACDGGSLDASEDAQGEQ